jgi:predicted ATPase
VNFYVVRSELQPAQQLAAQMLSLAQSEQDPAFLLAAHNAQKQTLFQLGDLTSARSHLEQGLALYDPQKHHALAGLYGEDPGVSCRTFAAWIMWHLGYPDQALQYARTVKKIAEELAHPFSLAQALSFGAAVHLFRREGKRVQEMAEALTPLCREQGFALWLAGGKLLHGGALTEQGQGEAGIAEMRQGLADWRATGAAICWPCFLGLLAEAHGKVGQPEEGLGVLAEALEASRTSGEVWYDAELYRLKGQLTLQSKPVEDKSKVSRGQVKGKSEITNPQPLAPGTQAEAEAEAYFLKAIEIARQQSAKSLELRSAVSLSRLWQSQGKITEARALLSEIYGWFTEGFDTADLQEAKVLLEELGRQAEQKQGEKKRRAR